MIRPEQIDIKRLAVALDDERRLRQLDDQAKGVEKGDRLCWSQKVIKVTSAGQVANVARGVCSLLTITSLVLIFGLVSWSLYELSLRHAAERLSATKIKEDRARVIRQLRQVIQRHKDRIKTLREKVRLLRLRRKTRPRQVAPRVKRTSRRSGVDRVCYDPPFCLERL